MEILLVAEKLCSLIGCREVIKKQRKKGGDMQIERCKVCGGTVDLLGNRYIRCDYCGQIYDISGKALLADQVYKDAVRKQEEGTIAGNEEARMLLEGISGYKDSDIRAIHSYTNVENIKIAAEEKRLEDERQHQIQLEEQRKKEEKQKKVWTIACAVGFVVALSAIIAVVVTVRRNNALAEQYEYAVSLYTQGEYAEAEEAFDQIKDYEDSREYVRKIREILDEYQSVYEDAVAKYNAGAYSDAILAFMDNINYLDSAEYIDKCADALLEEADGLVVLGDYDGSESLIGLIPEISHKYSNGQNLLAEIDSIKILNKYNAAIALYNNQQYVDAQKIFLEIVSFEESKNYLESIGTSLYENASSLFNGGNYIDCVSVLKYIDESTEWSGYESAKSLISNSTETYKTETEGEALRILKNSSYDDFASYLNGRVCDIYSSNDATNLANQWKPVDLSSLTEFNKENYGAYCADFTYNSGIVDNLGATHNNVLMGGGYTSVYHINGQYNKISGYAFITQEKASTKQKLVLKISNENDIVLYRLELTGGDMPKEFTVDISGVIDLKIYFNAYDPSLYTNEYKYGGVSDLILFSVPD